MLSQKLYDANYDADLIGERKTAKDLCYDFNQLRPSDEEKQQAVMKKLLGRTKGAFTIVSPFWCDYGYNIEIGENFFANHNTILCAVPRPFESGAARSLYIAESAYRF